MDLPDLTGPKPKLTHRSRDLEDGTTLFHLDRPLDTGKAQVRFLVDGVMYRALSFDDEAGLVLRAVRLGN